ncbi:MAG: hypothetical protein AAF821_11955 [Cyanobacteria bacterium P01_D01_bin.156]
MDKRQLKQSATADFMQSLEQLNDLWGDELEDTELEADNFSSSTPKDVQNPDYGLPAGSKLPQDVGFTTDDQEQR